MLVPVLDSKNIPLMPCHPARARKLMNKGDAIPFYQKGIFCIKLLKEPSERNYQDIALGIDPGSKREGYTVSTENKVVLNITTNTPDWVKKHVETRRMLRRKRRQRNTPYRKCRLNRAVLKNKCRLPPSTRARWNAKLRIISLIRRILPITIINVEDVAAIFKKGDKNWNKSFSPIESGKNYFYSEIKKLKSILLIKTKGFDTFSHRTKRGFEKSKKKLDYVWEAHNVDSHCLCEITLGAEIKPDFGMYRIDFLEYHRRQLHVQNPIKGNIRKQHGGTVSLCMSRGSVLRYKNKLYYLGGYSEAKGLSLHSISTGKRIIRRVKKKNIEILYRSSFRIQFLPNQTC